MTIKQNSIELYVNVHLIYFSHVTKNNIKEYISIEMKSNK